MSVQLVVLLWVLAALFIACDTKEPSKDGTQEGCYRACRERHMAYDVTQEQVEATCAKECGPR